MFTLLWKWIVSFFTADKIGVLVRILLIKSGTTLAAEILDVKNQKKAIEFVRELNSNTEMTNTQKAKEFNKKMLHWAAEVGKKMTASVVNCLREMAVNAVKIENESTKEIR